MATVMGGVSYGVYFTAKRYILPLISPPTQPKLEQDKAALDESFKRTFDLLEQLNTDTEALKASEEARTTRLDVALTEMETVLSGLKDSSKRQGDDNRRIEDDVRNLRKLIPEAMDAQKNATDIRLKELSTELKSLKTLVGNRVGTGAPRPPTANGILYGAESGTGSTPNSNGTSTPAQQQSTPVGTAAEKTTDGQSSSASLPSSTSAPEKPQSASSSFGRFGAGKAAIPAWQMAAAKKNEESKKDTSESGTAAEAGPS
jgi:peroxin-14